MIEIGIPCCFIVIQSLVYLFFIKLFFKGLYQDFASKYYVKQLSKNVNENYNWFENQVVFWFIVCCRNSFETHVRVKLPPLVDKQVFRRKNILDYACMLAFNALCKKTLR